MIGDPTYADAILDRLVHNAVRIDLDGEACGKSAAAARKRLYRKRTQGAGDFNAAAPHAAGVNRSLIERSRATRLSLWGLIDDGALDESRVPANCSAMLPWFVRLFPC